MPSDPRSESYEKTSYYKDFESDLMFVRHPTESSKGKLKMSARSKKGHGMLISTQDVHNYEEIKQRYIMKKKKGKSKSKNFKSGKSHKSTKSGKFSLKSSEGPSKKTSKASTKAESSKNRTKRALLNTKTNDYLKSYLEFSKKSKKSLKFFGASDKFDKSEKSERLENMDKFAKTYDENGKLKIGKLNWLKINKDTNMLTQESKKPKKSFLWKKGKTNSISSMKKSKKKISHKHMKSSIPIGRHKREMSLDRFRDELNKFKNNRNKDGI
jgi:hypothetical protein